MLPAKDNRPVTLKAWKQWMTPRRIFYIVILVLLFVSIILLVIAVSITSCAVNPVNVPPPAPIFNETLAWLTAPTQMIQGSIMLSSDYGYALLFTDDLYLINFNTKKILWNANSNLVGPLTLIPTSNEPNSGNGQPIYGSLQLKSDGNLTIVDGAGIVHWTNSISQPPVSPNNPWVLVVNPNGALQIQNEQDANAFDFSTYIWRVDESTSDEIPVLSAKVGPFVSYPETFVLQSPNKEYMGKFLSSGIFSITYIAGTTSWTSTINPAVTTQHLPYSLQLSSSGEISIIDGARLTLWSSQTANYTPGSLLIPYEIRVSNTGFLELYTSPTATVPLWTSATVYTYTEPALSMPSPTIPFTKFSLISPDAQMIIRFNSEDTDNPALTTNGDLQLINTSLNSSIVSLSQTAGIGQTLTLQPNGTLIIQDAKGSIVFSILSPLGSTIDPNLPISLVVMENQLLAFRNVPPLSTISSTPTIWALPYVSPNLINNLPISLTGSDLPLLLVQSLQSPSIYFVLRSADSQFVLQVDMLKGTLSVIQALHGTVIENQIFTFPTILSLSAYFSRFGLFLLRNTDTNLTNPTGNGVSSWNSGTSQEGNDESQTSIISSGTGIWQIWTRTNSKNTIIWSADGGVSSDFSVSSIINVNPSSSLTPATNQSQEWTNLHLYSFNRGVEAIFDEKGSLNIFSNGEIIWSSNTPGTNHTLKLDSGGNLSIIDNSSATVLFTVTNSITMDPHAFPATLWVSDVGSLNCSSLDHTLLWSLNTPVVPSSVLSPAVWTLTGQETDPLIILLTPNVNEKQTALQFFQGQLSVVQIQNETVLSPPLWIQSTPPSYANKYPIKLQLQNSGNLIMTDSNVPPLTIWATNTANFYDPEPPYTLLLTTDTLSIRAYQSYSTPSNEIWNNSDSFPQIALSTSSPAILSSTDWLIATPYQDVKIQVHSTDCSTPLTTFTQQNDLKYSNLDSAGSQVELYQQSSNLIGIWDSSNGSEQCALLASSVITDSSDGPYTLSVPNYQPIATYPLLFVNSLSGQLLASWPPNTPLYQVPSQVCAFDGVQNATGFQLLDSKQNAFLTFTKRTKQLILRNGTPLNPALSVTWQTPDYSSLTNSNLMFQFLMLPIVGFLVVGYFDPIRRVFVSLWYNQVGLPVLTNYQYKMFLGSGPSLQLATTTSKTSCNTSYLMWSSTNTPYLTPPGLVGSIFTNNFSNGPNNPGQISYNIMSAQLLMSNQTPYPNQTATLNSNSILTSSGGYLPDLLYYLVKDLKWSLNGTYNVLPLLTKTFSSNALVQIGINELSQFQVRVWDDNNSQPYTVYSSVLPADTIDAQGYPGSFFFNNKDYQITKSVSSLMVLLNQTVTWMRPVETSMLTISGTALNRTQIKTFLAEMVGQTMGNRLSFGENGNMILYQNNSPTYLNSSEYAVNPYYQFNTNQLPSNSIFPAGAYRFIFTPSGNLIIRDQSNYVLFSSGTATYDESIPNLDTAIFTICTNDTCSNINLQVNGNYNYWSRGLNQTLFPFWSFSSPATVRPSQPNVIGFPTFPIRCNVQSSFGGNVSTWFFRVPCLNLVSGQSARNGELQIIAQTAITISVTSKPVVICQSMIWNSLDDGFYQHEDRDLGNSDPSYGTVGTNPAGTSFLNFDIQGNFQVMEGVYPTNPTVNQAPLFQIPSPGPMQDYEISVRTAGMLLQVPFTETTFWSSGRSGYLVCGLESTQEPVWQIPATLEDTKQNIFTFPIKGNYQDIDLTNYFTPWAYSGMNGNAPILISGNKKYGLLFQTLTNGSQSQLGVVDLSTFPGGIVNDLTQFKWYFPLVKSDVIYVTSTGNCLATQTEISEVTDNKSFYLNQVTFQTFTNHESLTTGDPRLPFQLVLRNSGRLQLLDALQNVLWNSPSAQFQGSADPSLSYIANTPRLSYTFNATTLNQGLLQNSSQQALTSSGINFSSNYCPGIFLFSANGTYCAFPNSAGTLQLQQRTPTGSVTKWISTNNQTGMSYLDSYFYLNPTTNQIGITVNPWNPNYVVPVFPTSWSGNVYPPLTMTLTDDGKFVLRDMINQVIPVVVAPSDPWIS